MFLLWQMQSSVLTEKAKLHKKTNNSLLRELSAKGTPQKHLWFLAELLAACFCRF